MNAKPTEVSFAVGGRKYTVACAPGEEAKVASLGALIDGKLDQLGGNLAPQEAQNLLFAALLLADELQEARSQSDSQAASGEDLKAQLAEAQQRAETAIADKDRMAEELEKTSKAAIGSSPTPAAADPDLAPALERFAGMLEECADKLEGKAPAP
ncbi:MAG: cell division protein ZapA [Alteripontixanthobacter sp.]